MNVRLMFVLACSLIVAGCKGNSPPAVSPPAAQEGTAPRTELPISSKAGAPTARAVVDKDPEGREFQAAVRKLKGSIASYREDKRSIAADFQYTALNDDDMKELRKGIQATTKPIWLNLNSCEKLTDAGLVHLKDLPNLVGLLISGKKITDKGMESVGTLSNLEELRLSSDNFTDAALEPLAKLKKIRKLGLHSKNITEAGFVHLAGMTEMEHLDSLTPRIGDVALGHIKGMTKLKELEIGDFGDNPENARVSDVGMAHVKNFTELRKFHFHGQKVTPAGLASLAALKKLEELEVKNCRGINSGPGMAPLKDLTNLERLEFIYCGSLTPEATAHLAGLTKVRKIRFEAIQDEALAGIKGLSGLEELSMFYTGVGDPGMAHLAGLKGLRELNLMKTQVTDAGLKHLSGLTKLEKLNLGDNNGITGLGLKDLSDLTSLKDLYLADCKITDAGLKDLSRLSALKELGINGNPITDAGVVHLKGLKHLKDLRLTGTKVSEDAAEELKKALPDTRITDASGSEVTLAKEEERPKPKVEDLTKVKPAFSLTAKEFAEENKKDKAAAAEKYKDKVIELTGVVQGFGRDISGGTHVHLSTGKQLENVVCVTVDEEPWSKVMHGQTIKIKGKWPEFSFSPALIYCVFVETGPYKPTILTADQLAKEFAADPEATKKKYDDKYLVLTGEIASKEYNSVGASSIVLKTTGKVKVSCSFTAFEKDLTKKMKAGQKVKVLGQYTLNFGNDEVSLYFCLPFKQP